MSVRGGDPIRRVVTGHDGGGRAIIRSDDQFTPARVPSGDADMALIWTTATVPADNNDEADGRTRDAGVTLKNGSVVRIVDMLPGCASPMHRTSSIDYGIILSGTLELELDDGAKTTLKAGDLVVQRGTIHLWRNPTADTVCRVVFVLIQAAPYQHAGDALPNHTP